MTVSVFADTVQLSEEQMSSIGVQLANPERLGRGANLNVPAEVTVPPDADHVVTSPLTGLITQLKRAPGESVEHNEPIAILHSQEILGIQRAYLASLSSHRLALQEYTRDEQLFEGGIIAERRVQASLSHLEEAEAMLLEQRSLLTITGFDQAAIDRLAETRQLSPEIVLRAPIGGEVVEKFVSVGERVESMAPIYRIAGLERLWVEARVPQERLPEVRIGDRFSVTGHRHDAEVIHIARAVDPSDQSVLVRAELTEQPADVLPGQFVTVQLRGRTGEAFKLPAAAVIRSEGMTHVFVRISDGFEVRPVSIVGQDAGGVLIGDGLYGRRWSLTFLSEVNCGD